MKNTSLILDKYEFEETYVSGFDKVNTIEEVGGIAISLSNESIGTSQPYPGKYRQEARQKWEISFDKVDSDVFNLLLNLYNSNKVFYVRYDAKMSRELAKCVCVDSTRTIFSLPTYPVLPATYDSAGTDYDVYLYNHYDASITSLTGEFSVDANTGIITFDYAIGSHVEVFVSYIWRCPVHITQFSLTPESLSQYVYSGKVDVEEVSESLIEQSLTGDKLSVPTYTTSATPPVGFLA